MAPIAWDQNEWSQQSGRIGVNGVNQTTIYLSPGTEGRPSAGMGMDGSTSWDLSTALHPRSHLHQAHPGESIPPHRGAQTPGPPQPPSWPTLFLK